MYRADRIRHGVQIMRYIMMTNYSTSSIHNLNFCSSYSHSQ